MLEEEVIVQHVLDLALCGVPPSKAVVQDMANKLLQERNGKPVGKNWVDNFVKRNVFHKQVAHPSELPTSPHQNTCATTMLNASTT